MAPATDNAEAGLITDSVTATIDDPLVDVRHLFTEQAPADERIVNASVRRSVLGRVASGVVIAGCVAGLVVEEALSATCGSLGVARRLFRRAAKVGYGAAGVANGVRHAAFAAAGALAPRFC